jgi:BRCA1-associated protein
LRALCFARLRLADSSFSQPWRDTRLLVLAVPTRVSPDDFIRFCGPYLERASDIRFIM